METEDGLRVTHYVNVAAQVHALGAEEHVVPILLYVLKKHRVTNGEVQKMLGAERGDRNLFHGITKSVIINS